MVLLGWVAKKLTPSRQISWVSCNTLQHSWVSLRSVKSAYPYDPLLASADRAGQLEQSGGSSQKTQDAAIRLARSRRGKFTVARLPNLRSCYISQTISMREVSWHCAWGNRNDVSVCRIAGRNVADQHLLRSCEKRRRFGERHAYDNHEEDEKDSLHA